jgi:type I restriction enzyme M protein
MSPSAIVQKLWNYCNVLRDDGMSYGDYVEQLTFALPQDGLRTHEAAVQSA